MGKVFLVENYWGDKQKHSGKKSRQFQEAVGELVAGTADFDTLMRTVFAYTEEDEAEDARIAEIKRLRYEEDVIVEQSGFRSDIFSGEIW